MDFFKFIGGIFIVISGTFCGIYFSVRLKKRAEFLEQYIIFLVQTQTMINYGAMSVKEILSAVRGIPLVEPVLRDTEKFLDSGMNIEKAWKKSIDRNMKELGFGRSDTEMLYFFGSSFGISDVSGELTKIKLHSELIKEHTNKLKDEILSKCRIYRITGMFCGVLTAVMLC